MLIWRWSSEGRVIRLTLMGWDPEGGWNGFISLNLISEAIDCHSTVYIRCEGYCSSYTSSSYTSGIKNCCLKLRPHTLSSYLTIKSWNARLVQIAAYFQHPGSSIYIKGDVVVKSSLLITVPTKYQVLDIDWAAHLYHGLSNNKPLWILRATSGKTTSEDVCI